MKRIVLLLAVFTLLLASGCGQKQTGQKTDMEALAAVEVKEYQGRDLSSIKDFRENSIKGPQFIDIKTYTLAVDGLVEHPGAYTYDEVLAHKAYQKVITLNCVEGWSVDILWEGILLRDLFDKAGVRPEANTVIFYSYDGYSTSLPLDWVVDANIILAYKMNGVELPPERGFPFQLVAQSKLGYKWAKWITHIELSKDSDYKGYWESRGYSNEAYIDY